VYVDEIDKRGSVFVDLILLLNLHFKNKKKRNTLMDKITYMITKIQPGT
jgi:hypothetical protein